MAQPSGLCYGRHSGFVAIRPEAGNGAHREIVRAPSPSRPDLRVCSGVLTLLDRTRSGQSERPRSTDRKSGTGVRKARPRPRQGWLVPHGSGSRIQCRPVRLGRKAAGCLIALNGKRLARDLHADRRNARLRWPARWRCLNSETPARSGNSTTRATRTPPQARAESGVTETSSSCPKYRRREPTRSGSAAWATPPSPLVSSHRAFSAQGTARSEPGRTGCPRSE